MKHDDHHPFAAEVARCLRIAGRAAPFQFWYEDDPTSDVMHIEIRFPGVTVKMQATNQGAVSEREWRDTIAKEIIPAVSKGGDGQRRWKVRK